jgi:cyclophilin family peptidyl-prolyl cis-trans isomerase
MFPAIAPLHVRNWDSLVARQFFDSTAFHRVVPGFVIQGGDPNSRHGPRSTWGYGQPNQPNVVAEFNAVSHERGILSAARDSDPNSANSQFFICVAAARSLNGNYTVYGRVTSGIDIVDQIVGAPRDANDNPLQKIEMFITRTGSNDTLARVPQLVAPADRAIGQLERPILQWRRDAATMISYVQLATDSTFATGVIYDEQLSQRDTSMQLGQLTPATTYYWRLKSNNGGSVSPWSATWRFRTGTLGPNLLLPANNAVGVAVTPQLTWQPLPGATRYQVQIARSAQFPANLIVLDTDTVTQASFTVPAPGLTPNARRFWRVRAVAGTDPSFFSTAWSFTPAVVGLAEGQEATDWLAPLHPNPALAGSEVVIPFTLPVTSVVSLTVVDVLGRTVARPVEAQPYGAGSHYVALAARALAPGVYFCRLDAGGHALSRRLVVQ